MDLLKKIGRVALGSRLRMLTDIITRDASNIYKLYNIDLQPKWFPVFYALSGGDAKTITSIAKDIGHSHPSVSKIVAEMIDKGLAEDQRDSADGRNNMVKLSQKGLDLTVAIQDQYTDVSKAIEDLSDKATHDLWKAIEEWEELLKQKTLLDRVVEQKKMREIAQVQVVDYRPEYAVAFKDLNVEWISKYFRMEKADYDALDDPDGYILSKGGHILIALYQDEPVGVCALIKMNDNKYDYELAKMAVSPKAQGKRIGYQLGMASIEKAKSLGARYIYLESNTILEPAINLYRKLGFKEVYGRETPYERCNIQMELEVRAINF